MNDSPLNVIKKTSDNWHCIVFDFNQINAGGVYLDFEDYDAININSLDGIKYRLYSKKKQIVISGSSIPSENFCALNFRYKKWRCRICKRILRIDVSKCLCTNRSTCWTPMDVEISGIILQSTSDFLYHFQ